VNDPVARAGLSLDFERRPPKRPDHETRFIDRCRLSCRVSGWTRGKSHVADLIYVVVTIAAFAILALVLRGAERL
jgi:hypothetical protein